MVQGWLMAKILIVEDDVKYAGLIGDYLKAQSHTIDTAANVNDALAYLNTYEYEVLIVDWMLPDGEGPTLIRSLRSRGCKTPTLMLTARETIDDKERGFWAGVDDYLIKDAHPRELVLRIDSLLRRPVVYESKNLSFRGLEIDLDAHTVKKNGTLIHLLPKEFGVLVFLGRYPHKMFTAEELLQRLWPSDTDATTQSVRSAVNKLRMKLDTPGEPSLFVTRYKAGYKLNIDAEATELVSGNS
jgi:DNA-binding response OmpR family regulator